MFYGLTKQLMQIYQWNPLFHDLWSRSNHPYGDKHAQHEGFRFFPKQQRWVNDGTIGSIRRMLRVGYYPASKLPIEDGSKVW